MRAGWEGNHRLQDFVRRLDSGAGLIAEVATVAGSDIVQTKSDWGALTATGSIETLDRGGVRILATETVLAEHTTGAGADVTALTTVAPFDAILIRHIGGNDASERELHTLTARLDPRLDGGQPKTVDHWIAEAYRVTREYGESAIDIELIGRTGKVDAAGEVADDFDFSFATPSGRFPNVGPPPEEGASHPLTLIRIIAYQVDGTIADNVSWLADSAQGSSKTNSTTYQVTHYSVIESTGQVQLQQGGSVWELGSTVNNMPRFSLSQSSYAQAVLGAIADAPVADISGAGDLTVVARGEEWADSVLTWEIYDGTSAWVACVDGDVLGVDNRQTLEGIVFGSDLSTIPTTGPWDLRVTLDPSSNGLRSPVALDFGIERVTVTNLAGAARVKGGSRTLDIVTLKANIPTATVEILKTGDRDFRDYGTTLVTANHIGEIEVRVYVGDPSGEYLHRSEWMLHSVWEIDDYESAKDAIRLQCVSPLRRLKTAQIPPFVATSGSDGERKDVVVSGTRKAAYDEIVDTLAALPARLRGPGVEDTTNVVRKRITEGDAGDAKAELDRIAYLGGEANVESQGRLKAVAVMRDEPIDYIVARFEPSRYIPLKIGPGFNARTDEFFVKYNFEETDDRFENERRYLNATAAVKLGGAGLSATRSLDEKTARWIITQALADLVGDRVPKYLANGAILWEIQAHDRNPQIEQGDVVIVGTESFAARSPLTDQPLRGRLNALAVVVDVGDFWGQRLRVWVPGFEYIAVAQGTVTLQVGPLPTIQVVDHRARSIGASSGNQRFERDVTFQVNALCRSVEVEFSFVRPNKTADQPPPSTTFDVDYHVDTVGPMLVQHTLEDGAASAFVFLIQDNAGATIKDSSFTLTLTPYSETGGSGGTGYAGQSASVLVDTLGDSDDVGVRVRAGSQEFAGSRLIEGTGVSFSINSDGEIVVSSP